MLDNDYGYALRENQQFLKNMPTDFLINTITFEEPIPDYLSELMFKNIPMLRKERLNFLHYHKDIISDTYKNRLIIDKILESGDYNEHIYDSIEFLKKHPEYKQIVDYVEIFKLGEGMNPPSESISLDEFIEDIYYNPYLNEKKYVIE